MTAIWKRPRLTRLMLQHARAMALSLAVQGIDLGLVAVGSEYRKSRRLAQESKWDYLEAPNAPLSDKFNAGVEHARILHPDLDAVIIIGSDDFANGQCYLQAAQLLRDGAQYIVPNGLHFWDTESRRMLYLGSHTTGTFRVLSRELLEALDWKPYFEGAMSGIDRAMTDKVRAELGTDRFAKNGAARLLNTNPGSTNVLLDVKTKDSMHSFHKMSLSITSRFVSNAVLDVFGSTGIVLRDFVPWRSKRWLRRHLKNVRR